MPRLPATTLLPALAATACLAATATAGAQTTAPTTTAPDYSGGGAMFIPPPPPPKRAKIVDGLAVAPRSAPRAVKRMIAAANRIVGKPYVYGGGHSPYARDASTRQTVLARGYDCSGSVSFALYGGRRVRAPLDSSGFMSWGRPGPGRWVTVYANAGHAYVVIAGLRFDTALRDDPRHTGPAWSKRLRRSASYVPRHPRGL